MSEWKELWLNNYKGINDTAELEKHLKTLGYGSRMNISYLPWAVVERIFRLQDGEVQWIPTTEHSYVDADIVRLDDKIDEDTGEVIKKTMRSYFINIHATWHGREYTERYPLQDSNGRPLSVWTQNDLNKAYQRGKVKAIAIVSGIGYKLFEDGDLQFEEEKVKDAPKKEKPVVAKKEEPVVAKKEEPVVAKKAEPVVVEQELNRVDLENEVKQAWLKGGQEKAALITEFLKDRDTLKIADLDLNTLKELVDQL